MDICEAVKQELTELKKVGVRVPKKAFAFADTRCCDLQTYYDEGMRISDIADLIIQLN